MRLHSAIYYRSGGEEWDDPWQDKHFRARNLVKSLKSKPFNGYSDFQATDRTYHRVDNTEGGHAIAMEIAAAWVGKKVEEAGYAAALVVPIPASNHVALGADFTGAKLAAKIQEVRPTLVAAPVLYFAQAMLPSSQGGGRNSHTIQAQLRGGEALVGRGPVVLIDDVYTTGAHFRASVRYLATLGVGVADGFVMARTVWAEPANMFICEMEEIDTSC